MGSIMFLQTHKASGIDSSTLWDKRMGYPSNEVVNLHPGINTLENDEHQQIRDILLTAKQIRDVFNFSNQYV